MGIIADMCVAGKLNCKRWENKYLDRKYVIRNANEHCTMCCKIYFIILITRELEKKRFRFDIAEVNSTKQCSKHFHFCDPVAIVC